MKRIKIQSTDFIGLGQNGRTFFPEDLRRMNVGDEYSNVTEYGELALRATKRTQTKLFLQLEERYYDEEGTLYKTFIVEKYEIEWG